MQAQRPDDHRTFYQSRPLLELNLDLAKWLSHTPDSSDAERFLVLLKENVSIRMCVFFSLENYRVCSIRKRV